MSKDVDIHQTMADGKWQFNADVATVFDEMLERSIPQYQVMRDLTTYLAKQFLSQEVKVVDLGCSRGEALAPLVEAQPRGKYIGLEVSEPMIEAAKQRFKSHPDVEIRRWDLRDGMPYGCYEMDVALSVLTLMFTPINYRLSILEGIYKSLRPGGALLLVEKVLGSSAFIDARMVERYHKMKAANGYSIEEIERKRLALEGVQVPLTAAWNEEALKMAGFRQVDSYFRWMNFAAWVAVR